MSLPCNSSQAAVIGNFIAGSLDIALLSESPRIYHNERVQSHISLQAFRFAAFVLVFVFAHSLCAADTLHRREVKQKNSEGKDLVMTFEELIRDEKTSTAKVTLVSGASVPSIMFTVRGFYDIAQARGSRYFIKLREWKSKDGGWMYIVGFANDKDVDPNKFFLLSEPLPKSDEYKFMSVEDLNVIFKDK